MTFEEAFDRIRTALGVDRKQGINEMLAEIERLQAEHERLKAGMTEAEALRSAMRALHEIAYGPAGEQAADWEDYANTLRAYAKRALQEIGEEQECGPEGARS